MEARYRGLLEAAPDAMVVVDEDSDIILVNAQAEKQFGYLKSTLEAIAAGHPQQRIDELLPWNFRPSN
ncbi:PAS domain S-box protein [Roseovarius sp. D0-M9]|uniref:PAS domain S-box protein n=1 Tax=Roseovarius sp. D0-M9 TaxID=3127117 RepID=UPI003FA79E5C